MLRQNKLGQGLPISTIIIAALGILVLVVLGVIFSRGIGWFGKDLTAAGKNECPAPYTFEPIGTQCADVIYGNFKDHPNEICCKKGTTEPS